MSIEGKRQENFGEKLGTGVEKTVYTDPDNEKLAKAVFHREAGEPANDGTEQTPEYIRARFYLTKILHLLYPKNIPDVHMSTSEPNMLVIDRVEHDKATKLKGQFDKLLGDGPDMPILNRSQREIMDKLNGQIDKEVKNREVGQAWDFAMQMGDLGVPIDDNWWNFSLESNGDLKYVDSFKPWFGDTYHSPGYKIDALTKAINSISNESDKKKALNYLGRLEKLLHQ